MKIFSHKKFVNQTFFSFNTNSGNYLKLLLVAFCVMVYPFLAISQEKLKIVGRVTAEDNRALSSVSVFIKGQRSNVVTDENGNYTIEVAKGATLVFSFIGFESKEVKVESVTNINIVLTSVKNDLETVVVVGYGTQRKKDVTGAVVSVSEKALREVPVANVQQALQGRAAGLEVQTVGNQPGAGTLIRIRGARSITGSNDPLFVVDGIPWEGSLADLNPNDIASIDILKDASATAIYGSRGANGVIIVSTKKGKNGEARVSYNGYHGIGKVANPYPVFNAAEYQAMRNISPWGQGYLQAELDGIAKGTNTNWQDLMYNNSLRSDHNISVSGGSNNTTYSIGGNYFKETSALPGEDFTRYNVRGTIDTKIGSRIKIGLNTLNSLSLNGGSQFVSGSSMFRNIALTPLTSPYNADGSLNLYPAGNIDDLNGSDRYTPLLLRNGGENRWVDRVRRLRTINNFYGEIEFIKGLRYRVNFGLNYAQQHGAQFRGSDQPNNPSYFRPAQGNIARVSNGETWGYTLENLIYFDKTIKKHKINFTGLYSIQENQSFDNFVQKDSITEDFVQWYNLSLSTPINGTNTSIGGGESRWALISYMARINYSFDDKYLLTLTGRIDGSSRLAKGNNYFTYPAISAGWNIDNESFLKNVKEISTLRLRAGWGKTSNQAIAPYASLGLVSNNNGLAAGNTGGNIIRYNFGPTIITGYNLVNLPNPNLRWEFTNTLNLGIDFGFFKNRITGSIEYYNAQTDDVLYNVTLPVTSGVAGAFQTNVGKIENKGFELSLSSINYTTKDFRWSTDFNLFFNRNKVLRLSNNITRDIGNQLHVGYPLSAIWDYQKLGIWQISEAADAAKFGARPGQIKLLDYGGAADGKPDGIINTADQHIIGNGDASIQGGMTQRITYKNFDFSTVFYARFGGTLISQVHQPNAAFLTIMDGRRNSLKVDYWTPTNPTNWFPMPQSVISPQSTAWSTLGYYDASFLKIRSINLGYNLPASILKKMKIQNARVYATIDNVAILFSPYYNQTGIDPEGTGQGNQGVSNPGNIRGGGNGAVTIGLATPQRRTFTFGANITL